MPRAQIIFDPADFQAFRAAARREGLSLSAWLRRAARERLAVSENATHRRLDDRRALEGFFAECDEREAQPEPDWADHDRSLLHSRRRGLDTP